MQRHLLDYRHSPCAMIYSVAKLNVQRMRAEEYLRQARQHVRDNIRYGESVGTHSKEKKGNRRTSLRLLADCRNALFWDS